MIRFTILTSYTDSHGGAFKDLDVISAYCEPLQKRLQRAKGPSHKLRNARVIDAEIISSVPSDPDEPSGYVRALCADLKEKERILEKSESHIRTQAQTITKLQHDLTWVNQVKDSLDREATQQRGQIATLEQSNRELRKGIKRLRGEIDPLKQSNDDLRKNNQELQDKVDFLDDFSRRQGTLINQIQATLGRSIQTDAFTIHQCQELIGKFQADWTSVSNGSEG